MTLQLKKDLLNNVLGEEKAKSFLQEVAEASKEREILHRSLLQSKSKLQVGFKARVQSLPVTKTVINVLLSQFYRYKFGTNQLCAVVFSKLIKYSNKFAFCCTV